MSTINLGEISRNFVAILEKVISGIVNHNFEISIVNKSNGFF